MLRLRDGQVSLWEHVLPAEVRLLSSELAAIDRLLDDDRFLSPFVKRLGCRIGRPTVPIETYLRLMYLKHRYELGYETLVKEVADSFSWRQFCRLDLAGSVPHPTTLLKLTRRLGPGVVEELNAALLRAAVERRVLRSRRMRVDMTVMEADVRYPTDSGLCAHAVSRLVRAVRRVKEAGLAVKTRCRNRTRSVGKVIRQISHTLGRAGGREVIDRLTGEVHRLAVATAGEASRVLREAKRMIEAGTEAGVVAADRLHEELERVERVIAQTTRRLEGERTIPDRLISLSDLDARPIQRGKQPRRTEFGYKVSIADTPEGLVVAHHVYVGNPADAETLQLAVATAKATGMRVKTVFADRGYGNSVGDQALAAEGIEDKVIPRRGRADPVQATRSWKRRYRFRCGCEGRISHLKRRHGLGRTRLKGYAGAQVWAGYGVLAHNLDRMAALQ